MTLQSADVEILPWVEASLELSRADHRSTRTYTYDPPPGVPRTTTVNAPHSVQIAEIHRPILSELSLDEEGFGLVQHRSAVRDFYDDAEVERIYREAEQLLKELTGADRVHVFDHTVRRRVPGGEDRRGDAPRQPVPRVHVDHTEQSGPQRVRDLLPDEAEELLRGRVQIINLWRPIRGPLLNSRLPSATRAR